MDADKVVQARRMHDAIPEESFLSHPVTDIREILNSALWLVAVDPEAARYNAT